MTRLEKLELAKEKGYTCNFEKGQVLGLKGQNLKRIKKGYNIFNIWYNNKGYTLLNHNFIWYMYYGYDANEGYFIDHINRDKSDNRIENLRLVTKQENSFNTNAKGYYFNKKSKKWQSSIMLNNKIIYLGKFDTEQEARKSYLEAKEKYHKI